MTKFITIFFIFLYLSEEEVDIEKGKILLLSASSLASAAVVYQLLMVSMSCIDKSYKIKGKEAIIKVNCKKSGIIDKINGEIRKKDSSLNFDLEVKKLGFTGYGHFQIKGEVKSSAGGLELKKITIYKLSSFLFFKRKKGRLDIENLYLKPSGTFSFLFIPLNKSKFLVRFEARESVFILFEDFSAELSIKGEKGIIGIDFKSAEAKGVFENNNISSDISNCSVLIGSQFSISCSGKEEENIDDLLFFYFFVQDFVHLW